MEHKHSFNYFAVKVVNKQRIAESIGKDAYIEPKLMIKIATELTSHKHLV